MGEIGIDRHEFLYELSLWEINSIVEGYRHRAHTAWETTRWQTFCILCALGVKNLHKPEDLQPFSWDEDGSAAEEMTQEDAAALQAEMAAINEQLAKNREKDRQDNSALH